MESTNQGIEIDLTRKMKDFSVHVQFKTEKKRIGILGASGCGKSMTLKMIAGILQADSGKIKIDGKTLYDDQKNINIIPQKRKVGFLFQNYALFPNMTVAENVAISMTESSRQKRKEKALEWLRRFSMEELSERYPKQLSGGQQQRVALIRILAYQPDIILLDEPFSALDGYLRDKMQRELMSCLSEFQGPVILVSHSQEEIYQFAQELIVMDKGKVIKQGEPKEIFENPELATVAKLTGCQNIAPATWLDKDRIYIEDWDLLLKVDVKPEEISKITHAGIRAHEISDRILDEENNFVFDLVEKVELPFEDRYFIKRHGKNTKKTICWKKQKKLEEKQKKDFPCTLAFPREQILLLKDTL